MKHVGRSLWHVDTTGLLVAGVPTSGKPRWQMKVYRHLSQCRLLTQDNSRSFYNLVLPRRAGAEAAGGGRHRARVRDRAHLSQRGRLRAAQPRVHHRRGLPGEGLGPETQAHSSHFPTQVRSSHAESWPGHRRLTWHDSHSNRQSTLQGRSATHLCRS